jgi:membrane-associated phospholipid phosphatase
VGHFLLIGIIVGLMWFLRDAQSKTVVFFRDWYPALLFLPMFEEMNYLVTIIFPYWANQWVINLDLALFGVYPTVWLEKIVTPWLTELMGFFYASYFLLIPIAGFPLYFRNRKREFHGFLFNVALAYYIAYIAFLFFPTEGPWVIMTHLQTAPLEGKHFFQLVAYLQGLGGIRGGCFPSAHVAGAFAILCSAYKYERKIFLFLLVFVLGLAVSTVYYRYHHAVDAIAGALLGTLCYFIGVKVHQRWERAIIGRNFANSIKS